MYGWPEGRNFGWQKHPDESRDRQEHLLGLDLAKYIKTYWITTHDLAGQQTTGQTNQKPETFSGLLASQSPDLRATEQHYTAD